jgi:VanZ family protein
MGLIFVLSAQSTLPKAQDDVLDAIVKKSAHLLVYAILAALWLRALGRGEVMPRKGWIVALAATCLYALSDEFHQYFVPGRTASLVDLAVDWLGAAAAAALVASRKVTRSA